VNAKPTTAMSVDPTPGAVYKRRSINTKYFEVGVQKWQFLDAK
jgi:hypothetical protein